MNGGSIKKNEDGSYNVSLTHFNPDRVGNILRRLFYVALVAIVGLIGQQTRTILQTLETPITKKAVAEYLQDPEVSEAIVEILRDALAPSLPTVKPPAKSPEPKGKPAAKPSSRPEQEPQGAQRRELDYITIRVPQFPEISSNQKPPGGIPQWYE